MSVSGELEVQTFNFTWKVRDFSKKGEKLGDLIYSPIFKIGDTTTESQWKLLLYPYGDLDRAKDYVSLFLQPLPTDSCLIKTYAFKLSLLDCNGNRKYVINSGLQSKLMPWGWPTFLRRDILLALNDTFLINDTLNIFCIITVNLYHINEFEKEKTLLNNYETLYLSTALSDLTILIGGKTIKAHKSILSMRSTVFSAMFKHNMREKNTDTIEIHDISYEVMNELLLFLYCGKVENLKVLAKPLMIAADKYDISSLKAICERTLFENLDVESACEVLVVADRYGCEKLKSETMDFIIKNMKVITPTAQFKELKTDNAELLEAIICKISENN